MGNTCAKGAAGLRSNDTPAPKSHATPEPGEKTTSTATPSPTFKWVIDGFSSLLDKDQGWIQSAVFEIMGIKWYLNLNPKHKKINDGEEFVSLKLHQVQSSVKLDTVVEASFRLKIYDQSNGKHRGLLVNHSFQTASTSSIISFMLPLKTLNEPSSGFLVNNSCIFGIEFIKVASTKANTTLETLYVRKMNIFNEAKVYTWEIEDFFALKNTSYSPEFEIGGYTWSILKHLSRDGNHLSLFLTMKKTNDLCKDSGNLVQVTLSIKNQENGKDWKITGSRFSRNLFDGLISLDAKLSSHIINLFLLGNTNSFQFSSISPCWGWDKFISLEDFKDTSKGYLIKGKCCIEAKVAINGSSKIEHSQ